MKRNLLIAEPDDEMRDAYEEFALYFHLSTDMAANGLECWKKLRTHTPDALIVDSELIWGGSDGVLARLREDFDEKRLPAVYVTGDDSPDRLAIQFGIPAERCFQKPFRIGKVLELICHQIVSQS